MKILGLFVVSLALCLYLIAGLKAAPITVVEKGPRAEKGRPAEKGPPGSGDSQDHGPPGGQGPPGQGSTPPPFINTSAATECAAGEVFTGDGVCVALPAGLGGQSCSMGEFVTGFDVSGNIICSAIAAEPPVGEDCPDNLIVGADLANCDLSNSDLTFLLLDDADLRNANLTFADLSNSTLLNAILIGADLARGILQGVDLTGADLTDANLEFADLTGTNLTSGNLYFASLNNANLTGTDLSNTNLQGADMTGADLSGITWNNTVCPDGTNSDDDAGDGFTCLDNL